MMLLEINKPNPVPEKDLVANFENNLGNISGFIHVPVSFILTIAWPSFFPDVIDIFPDLVNLRELLIRLELLQR
jgi:hypothetical protein